MGTWQLTSSSEDLMTARSGFISIVESNREGSSHDIRTNTPARLECTGDLHLNLAGILSITFFQSLAPLPCFFFVVGISEVGITLNGKINH